MEPFSFNGFSDYVDVHSILDGDTVSIIVPIYMQFGAGKLEKTGTYKLNIRLLGLDTYELKSQDPQQALLAQKAKKRLTELITECNNKVFVKLFKFDKYGRILGQFFKDHQTEVSFNDILINENLAKMYFGGTKS